MCRNLNQKLVPGALGRRLTQIADLVVNGLSKMFSFVVRRRRNVTFINGDFLLFSLGGYSIVYI